MSCCNFPTRSNFVFTTMRPEDVFIFQYMFDMGARFSTRFWIKEHLDFNTTSGFLYKLIQNHSLCKLFQPGNQTMKPGYKNPLEHLEDV